MILHLDLDSFFASAERTVNPTLIGKPVIVGGRGDPFIFERKPARNKQLVQLNQGAFVPSLFHAAHDASNYFFDNERIRGIVTTASYEARRYGVKTAMTIREALQLCPDAILLPPNHLLYHELSHQMMQLLANEVPTIEQYSIDEIFGDVTGWVDDADMLDFITHLQRKIATELLLPVSIGACNAKWMAKLATSTVKPYGVVVINDSNIERFSNDIAIGEFPGVGRAFSRKFKQYRINTIGEARRSKSLLYSWGRQGRDLYAKLCGTDHEVVNAFRSRKGVGMSRSMDTPILERDELFRRIHIMVRHWFHTMHKLGVNPTTFFFGLGYEHHLRSKKQYTTYRLLNEPFLQQFSKEKFQELDIYPNLQVRYIAMSATKFLHHDKKSVNLFFEQQDKSMQQLDSAIATMRQKYGMDIVRHAQELLL